MMPKEKLNLDKHLPKNAETRTIMPGLDFAKHTTHVFKTHFHK